MKAYSSWRPLLDDWITLSGNTLVEGGLWLHCGHIPFEEALGDLEIIMWTLFGGILP